MIKRFFLIPVLFLTAFLLHGCSRDVNPPKNVLIITLDTTRADRLGCYGNKKISTKNIDAIAEGGVLFTNAVSHAPITLPSHSSIMTGLYPYSHGVRDNSIYRLDEKNITLAEILKENGFKTAAFVGSFILDSQYGLNQGFDLYNDRFLAPKQKGKLPVDRRGEEVSELAIKWVEENYKNRFFLWLHYYDPHADYDPPEPFKEAYSESLYDGEIAYTDMCLGMVLKKLEEKGVLKDTLVVITADHGESLGEHKEATHGLFIYNSTTHVPVIINYPGMKVKTNQIGNLVRSIDILPTILDILKIPLRVKVQGKSLLSLIQNSGKWEDLYSYCEAEIPKSFYWNSLKSVRDQNWKYIHGAKPELYDLKNDQGESKNLLDENKQKAQELKKKLVSLLAEKNNLKGKGKDNILSPDEETANKLKSLGYFQGGGSSGKEGEESNIDYFTRPDPREMIEVYNNFHKANSLEEKNNYQGAIALFKKVIDADPQNPRFRLELGDLYYGQGKYNEAINTFKDAVKIDPSDSRCYFLLGNVFNKKGSVEEAVREYIQAIKLNPKHFMAHYNLGRIYTVRNRIQDAIREYEEALVIRPDHSFSLNNLAYIYIEKRKDMVKGIEYLKRAVRASPETGFILDNLGQALYENGDFKNAISNFEKALEIEKNNPVYYLHIGDAYKKLGEEDKAKESWKQALALSPGDMEAKKRLGMQ